MPDWILIVALVLAALNLLILLWMALRPRNEAAAGSIERLERELRDELVRSAQSSRGDLGTFQQILLTQSGDVARTQNEQIDAFRVQLAATQQQTEAALRRFSDTLSEQLQKLSDTNERRQAEMRQAVETRLVALQEGNEKKLEQMRATVDEKLHATLEQRLGESFKQVAERLEQVHKGLGEMQTLARDVGSLNRVLTNVKTRGIYGEVQLAGAAGAGLHARAVRGQCRDVPGSGERVEFAIRMPGRATTACRCGCRSTRSSRARTTSACWTPRTAPTRRAWSWRPRRSRPGCGWKRDDPREVHRRAAHHRLRHPLRAHRKPVCRGAAAARAVEALQSRAQGDAGRPDHAAGHAVSLQMGFRTLALEKRSAEVWQVLGAVKTEFGKFGEVLAKTKKKLEEASNTIDAGRGAHARDGAPSEDRGGDARHTGAGAAARHGRRRQRRGLQRRRRAATWLRARSPCPTRPRSA
jgi:DNA recombination protein RmuC